MLRKTAYLAVLQARIAGSVDQTERIRPIVWDPGQALTLVAGFAASVVAGSSRTCSEAADLLETLPFAAGR